MAPPDLQVVLWHDDGAAAGDVCAGVLAVPMRVISLPQVLVGCTLSETTETSFFCGDLISYLNSDKSLYRSTCFCLRMADSVHNLFTYLLSSTGPTLRLTLKARSR